jgi:hypothetical protein
MGQFFLHGIYQDSNQLIYGIKPLSFWPSIQKIINFFHDNRRLFDDDKLFGLHCLLLALFDLIL